MPTTKNSHPLRHLTLSAGLAVFALAALASVAEAAPKPALPGCNNPRAIARYLKLTEAQQDQTQSLRQALRTAVDPLQAQLEPIREQIDTALDAAAPNACSVGGLVVQADGIHDQIADLRDDFEEDFEALLTPDQLAKWQALQAVCRAQDVTTGA